MQHGTLVTLQLRLPEAQAAAFVLRINNSGQGRVGWTEPAELAPKPQRA